MVGTYQNVTCPSASWFLKFGTFNILGIPGQYYGYYINSEYVQYSHYLAGSPLNLVPNQTNGYRYTPWRQEFVQTNSDQTGYYTNVFTNVYTYFGTDSNNFPAMQQNNFALGKPYTIGNRSVGTGVVSNAVPLSTFGSNINSNAMKCVLRPIFVPWVGFSNQLQVVVYNNSATQISFTNPSYPYLVDAMPAYTYCTAYWPNAQYSPAPNGGWPFVFQCGTVTNMYLPFSVWSSPPPSTWLQTHGYSFAASNGIPYITGSLWTGSNFVTETDWTFTRYYAEPNDVEYQSFVYYSNTLVYVNPPLTNSWYETNIPPPYTNQPKITAFAVIGANLYVLGTGGNPGATFTVQSTGNLLGGSWDGAAGGTFYPSGTFTSTVPFIPYYYGTLTTNIQPPGVYSNPPASTDPSTLTNYPLWTVYTNTTTTTNISGSTNRLGFYRISIP